MANNRDKSAILHLHWPEHLYRRNKWILIPVTLTFFILKLIIAKIIGYKIVWTAHNIFPHDRKLPFDYLERYSIAILSNAIIAHCSFAREELKRKIKHHKNTFSIPLGNYSIENHGTSDRTEARKQLGIEQNKFIYLFFGRINPYKGVENLIESFNQIEDSNSILYVIGDCKSESLKNDIFKLRGENDQINLLIRTIHESEIPLYLHSADVFVAPFTRVTTSSSIILALEFGLPIIAPAMGCLPELLTPDCCILYEANQSNGLLEALKKIKNLDISRMRQESKRIANSLSWDITAEKTFLVYKSITNN